jgi:endoribonuclease L-PSP, putative
MQKNGLKRIIKQIIRNKFFMEKIKVSHPDRDPGFVTGAYSDGVIIDGFLYISGQAAVDFKTSKFILGSIEEETHRTLGNLKAIAAAAGATMDHVIKCTVHLSDINEFARFNGVYAQYFQGVKPARTTVQSVLAEGIKVEIDCIVKLP